ncbi:MAG: sulfotransferase family protein [Thainema sp.]
MQPVFIGGCERSGTTVLGAILGTHSDCLTIPEAYFKFDLFQAYASEGRYFNSFDFVLRLHKKIRYRIWQMDIISKSNSWKDIDDHPSDVMKLIVKSYSEEVNKSNFEFWIDHTPRNLVYPLTLLKFFPTAKMIHIVRDGRATAASVLPLDWGPNTIDRAAYWWVESVAHGLNAESVLNNSQIMRVHYEELIANPENTIKKICNFLELGYQPEMLSATGFRLPSYTISHHQLIGKSLDKSRISAWEKKLRDREIEIFELITGDFLQTLGYMPKYGNAALDITNSERQILRFIDVYKRTINKFRRSSRVSLAINKKDT